MGLVFIGIVFMLTETPFGLLVYSLGVLPIIGVRLHNRLVCIPERQRINTIMVVAALFLAIAGIAFYLSKNYWIVFILIAAVLDFYSSFRKFK
jgi:hypothetical protein